jgi:hypothetical protein
MSKDFSTIEKCIDYTKEFLELEEDWDGYSAGTFSEDVIERAIYLMIRIYKQNNVLPYFIVPTRSSGVGLNYRFGDNRIDYFVDYKCNIDVTRMFDTHVENLRRYVWKYRKSFKNVDDAPMPLTLIPSINFQ